MREDPKAKAHAANGWIGVTDNERFALLSRQRGIHGVNFRQPLKGGGLPPTQQIAPRIPAPLRQPAA